MKKPDTGFPSPGGSIQWQGRGGPPPTGLIPLEVPALSRRTARDVRFSARAKLFVGAFFVLFLGILFLLFLLLKPFLHVFLWGMILTMVFHPLNQRFLRWLGGRRNVAALLTTLVVLAVLGLPGTIIVLNASQEATRLYENLSKTDWEQRSAELTEALKRLKLEELLQRAGMDPLQAEQFLKQGFKSLLQNASKVAVGKAADLLKNAAGFLIQILFIAFALFFFFRDGSRYSVRLVELLPLEREHQEKIVLTFATTVTAVVRGMSVTAVVQGILAGLGFAVAGAPVPVLLGVLTAVTSLIPFIGAAGVWLPVCLWLASQGSTGAAMGLFLWGVGAISLSDNFIKPVLIGGRAQLPIFFLFFTILGGIKLYGFLGVFLGPVILSVALAFVAIYRDVYLGLQTAGSAVKDRRPARGLS